MARWLALINPLRSGRPQSRDGRTRRIVSRKPKSLIGATATWQRRRRTSTRGRTGITRPDAIRLLRRHVIRPGVGSRWKMIHYHHVAFGHCIVHHLPGWNVVPRAVVRRVLDNHDGVARIDRHPFEGDRHPVYWID